MRVKNYVLLVVVSTFLVFGAWLAVTQTGITGAVVGVEQADVDDAVTEQRESQEEVDVIVVLKEPEADSLEELKEEVAELQEEVLDDLEEEATSGIFFDSEKEFAAEHAYATVGVIAGTVTQEGIEKLENDPLVEKIVLDEVRHVFLDGSIPLVNASSVWNVTVNGNSLTGSGQAVCVIDTGVDYTHTSLGGCTEASFLAGNCTKVPLGFDYTNNDANPFDDHGHGTHVAGIVASTDSTYSGVAPGANIVAMKVCNAGGSCQDSDVIAGIDSCIANATSYNISVISISLGGGSATGPCDAGIGSAYASSINTAVHNNISVVIATGNTNGNATAGIAAPGCLANATKVTASTDADVLASYAMRHANFTDILVAPGSSITSLNDGGGTTTMSGTSMATPHISGVLALLQQFLTEQGKTQTVAQLWDVLNNTAVRINDSLHTDISYPRVRSYAALLAVDSRVPALSFVAPTPANGSIVQAANVTINLSTTESLSTVLLEWNGVNETLSQLHVTKSNLTDGTYTYKVFGKDVAGKWNSTAQQEVTISTANQSTITITSPVDNSYHRTSFNLNISVNTTGLLNSSYRITNGTNSTVLAGTAEVNTTTHMWSDLVNLSEGNYTLNVTINETLLQSKVATFVVDTTDPAFTNITINNSTPFNTDSVLFTVTLSEPGTVLFESNYSGNWSNTTMGNTFTLHGSGNFTPNENISYRFTATDLAGNAASSAFFSFVVQDRPLGAVNITSPVNGSVLELGSLVQFNATVVDPDSHVISYLWDFSGENATIQNPVHQFNTSANVTVTFTATDGVGSNSTSSSYQINDSSNPVVSSFSYDTEVHQQQDGSQVVQTTVFDYSGISNVSLHLDDVAQVIACSTVSTRQSCNLTLDGLDVGSYTFRLNATDNASHTISATYDFTVTSCSDDVENGNEDGVDCGGACDNECASNDDGGSSAGSSSGSSAGGGGGGGSAAAPIEVAEEPVEEVSESEEEEPVPEPEPEPVQVQQVEEAVAVEVQPEEPSSNLLTGAFINNLIPAEYSTKRAIASVIILALFGITLALAILVMRKKSGEKL